MWVYYRSAGVLFWSVSATTKFNLMKLKLLPIVFLTFPLVMAAHAVEPTAAEIAKLKVEIDSLDMVLNGGREKNNLRALAQVQGAMGSTKAALEFYLQAKKDVDYLKVGKRESDFREWRDRNEDRLKSPEYLAALQYQLRYLALSLQATSGKDPEESLKKTIPAVIGYLDDLGAVYEKMEGQTSVLKRSVLDSSVAEYLKLDITVKRDSDWTFVPGNVPKIYDATILPHYRAAKNSAGLQSAWDKRIAQEAMMLDWSRSERGQTGGIEGRIREMMERGGRGRFDRGDERDREREAKKEDLRVREEKQAQFKEERLPELLWSKYRDGLLFGAAKALALGKMSSHVKANLGHPQAVDWLEELKGFIDGGYDADSYYDDPDAGAVK